MIRVLDFEATGTDSDALICEVGHTDLDPAELVVGDTRSYLCRVPSMPPEVRAVHHIRAEETWDFPPYDRRCLFEEAVRAGAACWAAYNADFESRFIMGHLPMVCAYKAALRVWPDAPSHKLFGLLYWLEDNDAVHPDRARLNGQHRAGTDSYATALVVEAILREGYTGRDMMQWTREPAFMLRCPIGAWRGHLWSEVETSMLEWIMWKARDLGEDVRWNARREYERRENGND